MSDGFTDMKKGQKCPDCGFFVACCKCSEKFSKIDQELDSEEIKGVICYNCNGKYNHNANTDEGYSTISNCPWCGKKNSVRKF